MALNTLKNIAVRFVLVTLVASPFVPLMAQADTPVAGDTNDSRNLPAANNPNSGFGNYTAPANTGANNTTVSPGNIGCDLANMDICISNVVYYIAVGLGSSLSYLGAYVFDVSVQLSLNSLAYSLDFISSGWTAVRDIANMAFLFLIIYIALVIIFGAETSGTLPMLAGVILVALLINFSFFFTRIVIDAGNILAVQFYNAIPATTLAQNQTPGLASAINSTIGGPSTIKDLSAGIMNAIGIQTLFSNGSFNVFVNQISAGNDWLTRLIALSFLYLSIGAILWILFIMFMTAGIKFIVRMVVLWLAIVASPLAFIARALPNMKKKFYDPWQDMLIKHSLYPAFFLFIFWFLNKFLFAIACNGAAACAPNGLIGSAASAIQQAGTSGNFIGTVAVAVGNIGIRMGIIVALLYAGLKASESIGVYGASFAHDLSGRIGGMFLGGAGRLTSSSIGVVGRNTVGRVSNAIAPAVNRTANNVGGVYWRGLNTGVKKLQTATYDPRNAPGANKLKNTLEKVAGAKLSTGTAPTKGFADQTKEAAKESDDRRKERAAMVRDAANKAAINRLADEAKAGKTHDPADVDRIKNLTKRESGTLKAGDMEKVAHIITSSQLKQIEDHDKYSDKEKEDIRKKFNETNNDAPLVKAQRILANELRTLNASLASRHRGSLAVIDTNTSAGHVLTGNSVAQMRDEINDKMAQIREDIRAAAPGTAKDLQKDLAKLQNSLDSVKRLGEERGKVPPGVGKSPKAGEFVVS